MGILGNEEVDGQVQTGRRAHPCNVMAHTKRQRNASSELELLDAGRFEEMSACSGSPSTTLFGHVEAVKGLEVHEFCAGFGPG